MRSFNYTSLIVIHVTIAVLVYFFEALSKVYFLSILIVGLMSILRAPLSKKPFYVLSACAYVIGSEVFLRMTNGNFFYETSKYLVILFLVTGVFLGGGIAKKAYTYFVYLILLVPGIIVASSTLDYDTNMRTAVAFNLTGPVCLGVAALYCYNTRITIKSLQKILMFILLPIISTMTYLFLYAPSIKDTLSGTQSNFEASGGYGPNQVSTVLGLGIFILVGRLFLQSKTVFLKALNVLLLVLMSYRAIVTFSRGGVFVAGVIILAFVAVFYFKSSSRAKNKIIATSLILSIGLAFTWVLSSTSTDGLINKRYNNQDAIGRTKDDVTTGRGALLTNELNEFLENPFFGVGVGKLKELRFQKEGIKAASHNEMSRIVGEHGIFGVIAFLILLISPLFLRLSNKRNLYFYSFYLFWFLTINHSSMRIAAPAFIYGLCLLNIQYEKPAVHRKRTIKQG